MKRFIVVVALGVGMVGVRGAHADFDYQLPEVMVGNSDGIAVVQIGSVEAAQVKGTRWTYGQKATARVEQTLKGQLPLSLTLLGDENFVCGRCHFEMGRFLVFLRRENKGWAGTNYQLSVRKIEKGRVNWTTKNVFEEKRISLEDAISSVNTTLAAQAKGPDYWLFSGVGEENARTWRVCGDTTGSGGRVIDQKELEKWLRVVPMGTKLSLCNSCRGGMGFNASVEEVQNLRDFAGTYGLEFKVVPAG